MRLFARICVALGIGSCGAVSHAQTIKLVLAVGWEGREIKSHDTDALTKARDANPDYPFTHFVSPAYFLRGERVAALNRQKIQATLRPGDKVGLELGSWRSLANAAGVIFRQQPTFWGQLLSEKSCLDDCGGDIPVNVYPKDDAIKLTKTAQDTLESAGLGRASAARVTGWVASLHVLEAFGEQDIGFDFSAVPSELIARRIGAFPVFGWAKALWSTVTPHAQPFVQEKLSRNVTVVPQNVASLDYVPNAEVEAIFKEFIDRAKGAPETELTFQVGIYQETALMTAPRLAQVVAKMKTLASEANVALVPLEVPTAINLEATSVSH